MRGLSERGLTMPFEDSGRATSRPPQKAVPATRPPVSLRFPPFGVPFHRWAGAVGGQDDSDEGGGQDERRQFEGAGRRAALRLLSLLSKDEHADQGHWW